MPGKKKKKFIDKNKSVSFHLVHRSQKDPLQADEDSSKFVLLQTENPNDKAREDAKHRKEEERKFGVFYEDDYNYLQHLRERKPQVEWAEVSKSTEHVEFLPSLQLPESVFPSRTEEDVGLLNKAAPVRGPLVDWDPDIVAALDGDADFEDPNNQLDDDFMVSAMAEEVARSSDNSGTEEEDYASDECYVDEEEDRFDADDQLTFRSEETKSHFTSYSMTSSVIRRNEGLTLLDDKFEQMFEQYNDMEIGALDHDELEGHIATDSSILNQVLSEFEHSQKKHTITDLDGSKEKMDIDCESDSNDEELEKVVVEPPKERWDCESILSTYSNLYNHPKIITEPSKTSNKIKLSQKTGMPLDVLEKRGPTRRQIEKEVVIEEQIPSTELLQTRKKGQKESADEKRQRKDAVKIERRDRRLAKKANKIAFKEEEKRQEKIIINLQQNLKGIKMT